MALINQTSKNDIETAERKYQEKKQQLKDIEYELNLFELNAYTTYKENLTYEWFLFSSTINQARKWLEMLARDNKIDKRKKYEEKDAFVDVTNRLRGTLNQPDIEITDFLIGGFHNYANIIDFTCRGHAFTLDIPVIKNVNLNDYIDQGVSIFQITLYNHDKKFVSTWIGGTFDESELKDILQGWLDQCETTK